MRHNGISKGQSGCPRWQHGVAVGGEVIILVWDIGMAGQRTRRTSKYDGRLVGQRWYQRGQRDAAMILEDCGRAAREYYKMRRPQIGRTSC